ncbi:unnamed protein product, partial [Ectocarpus sp. 13 AM-2016]
MSGGRPWRMKTRPSLQSWCCLGLVECPSGLSELFKSASLRWRSISVLEKEVPPSAPASSLLPSPPTARGRTGNSCLKALTVALNKTCDGESWYTSTKELQLTSLKICMACRTASHVHLKVDARI